MRALDRKTLGRLRSILFALPGVGAAMLSATMALSAPGQTGPVDASMPPGIEIGEASNLRTVITQHEESGDYKAMILVAMDLRDRATGLEDRVFALRAMARGYIRLDDRERALNALLSAVDLAQAEIPATLIAEIYRDAGALLAELGRYQQGLVLVNRGLAFPRGEVNPLVVGNLLAAKAGILGALQQLDEAMAAMSEAMLYPVDSTRESINRRNNLGMIHKWRGDLDTAIDLFGSVLKQARSEEIEIMIIYALLELGDVNRIQGAYDAAQTFLDEALSLAQNSNQLRSQYFALSYLAKLDEALGQTAAAQARRDALRHIETDLNNEGIDNRATVLEISLEILERDKRIDQLQAESEIQALRLDRSRKLIILTGIASLLLCFALWMAVMQVRTRAAANRQLDVLANTDTLTGLYNRRYFAEYTRNLASTAEDPPAGALLLIDLDHFKRVNDRYGHEFGDAVLVAAAKRIQHIMRDEDLLMRWGGEEFLAFLPDCDLPAAEQVAQRLRVVIAEPPIVHNGTPVSITATVGLCILELQESFDSALRRADAALYEGKQAGRNCIRVAASNADEAGSQ